MRGGCAVGPACATGMQTGKLNQRVWEYRKRGEKVRHTLAVHYVTCFSDISQCWLQFGVERRTPMVRDSFGNGVATGARCGNDCHNNPIPSTPPPATPPMSSPVTGPQVGTMLRTLCLAAGGCQYHNVCALRGVARFLCGPSPVGKRGGEGGGGRLVADA